MGFVLLILIFYFIFHVCLGSVFYSSKDEVNIYFGVPGSGKTTYAAAIARAVSTPKIGYRLKRLGLPFVSWLFRNSKPPKRVYSNVPILGTYILDPKNDLGVYQVEDCKIIIDEASIEYNNRNFKSLSPQTIKFFKLHRHYGTSIDVFSQSYDDMDITLRRLAASYFLVRKSMLPFFITVRRIYRRIDIDKQTHQVMDMFRFGIPFVQTKYCFMPTLWKLFDSYDAPVLRDKEWMQYNSTKAADIPQQGNTSTIEQNKNFVQFGGGFFRPSPENQGF